MKVVHAIWEQRNLGIDCNEIEVEAGDSLVALQENIPGYETQYTVVKVPVGMMDVSLHLQSMGYRFMEVMTLCHHEGKLPELTRIQQRIVDSVSCEEMSDRDRDREGLFDQIRNGMFQDDRISLDPFFTQDQANNRYLGWIGDETDRGANLFKIARKGAVIGFFVLRKQEGGVCFACIGGIYPESQSHGFGFCLNYYEIYQGIQQGARRIVNAFSSNNRGASAIHMFLGYVLDEQYYVFVKHKPSR